MEMAQKKFSFSEVKAFVQYEAHTGRFIWAAAGLVNGITVGNEICRELGNGNVYIRIAGSRFTAARLAWFLHYGSEPAGRLRFVDGNRLNLCIRNIRAKYSREEISVYQARYRDRNRNVLADKERERTFGVSRQQYAEMFHAQNGCCAICSKPETATRNGKIKALAVDHNHETGELRGLLCAHCNTAIGKFGEDRDVLISAIRYLDKHSNRATVAALSAISTAS